MAERYGFLYEQKKQLTKLMDCLFQSLRPLRKSLRSLRDKISRKERKGKTAKSAKKNLYPT